MWARSRLLKVVSVVLSISIILAPSVVGMVRFGRIKKKTKAEPVVLGEKSRDPYLSDHHTDTDFFAPSLRSGPPSARPPRVSLPHVDTQLNMHQHNGLFDVGSTEGQNGSGSTAVESPPG